MHEELRIGQVAERSGVSIDTVRYYERRRLLPAAPRTAGGYRVFTSEAIERVLFIKQAQELGFSLEEISTLLTTKALMFTDLRGSTALYARIGDAAAYRLVREHFAFLAER